MFGIRWLNIFQLGLELKGYEKFTSLFRKIENMEFKSDTNNEQCIFVHEILNTNNIGEYLLCLDDCTLDNKKEMLLLKKGYDNNVVFVRGLQIEEQLTAKMTNEQNGQDTMVVILSQVTEHMLFSDIEYETQNNNDKIETLNGIMTNIDTIKSEKVQQYRELMNILENEKELMIKFNKNFDS